MFNNDYIMRQIEMLVRGVAVIAGLRQENRTEERDVVLTDTLRRFYGLSDRSVDTLPWRDLIQVASLGPVPDAGRAALLAQLVREKAFAAAAEGDPELSAVLIQKALCIYIASWLADDSLRTPEHDGPIGELIVAAGAQALPADALELLFEYHARSGQHARAEDRLFEWIGAGGGEAARERGRAFYEGLLRMGDEELARGGLPRDEAVQGLAALNHTAV